MNLADLLNRHGREIGRNIRNNHVEVGPRGLLLPRMGLMIHGEMHTWVNGRDHQINDNIVTLEGITYLLDAGVSNGTAIGTWYVSPFSGNYTPVSGLTAATYPTDATEFTSYTGNRKTYVDGGVSAGAMDNSASKASFAITGSATLYGAALLSVATKSSTGGKCLAAANFSPTRAVVNTDTLDVQYNLSGSST